MKIFKPFLPLVAIALITSCGDSSSNDNNEIPEENETKDELTYCECFEEQTAYLKALKKTLTEEETLEVEESYKEIREKCIEKMEGFYAKHNDLPFDEQMEKLKEETGDCPAMEEMMGI